MEEFLNNLRQNPSQFYFLVIFAILWGGGVLWGLVVVIRGLGKKNKTVKSLKRLGFTQVNSKTGMMLQIEDIAKKTLWHDFSSRVDEHPRKEFLKTEIDNGRISITYEIPEREYRKLHRATGLKEMIQIIKRKMVLSKILFRPDDGGEFYAQTNDTETIRAFKPRSRIKSTTGWVLCLAVKNAHASTFAIYRKFCGHRKFLMNMALRMAHIRPASLEGLLPEFSEEFEVTSADISGSQPLLSKQLQRLIIKHKDYMPQGLKLFLNSEGIWMTGEEWLNKKEAEQMLKLSHELKLELKKEVA